MEPVSALMTTAAAKNAIDAIAPGMTNAIWRTVKYPFKVGANVKALQPAIDALTRRRNDVRTRVETRERQGERVTEEVAGWIERVGTIEIEVGEIKRKYGSRGRCLGGLSFNCWSNYIISKNAAELLSAVQTLGTEGDRYEVVTIMEPPPAVQEVPIDSKSTPSVISNLKLARRYINDDLVGVIGLWGMGGVGKTHLLENINNSYTGDASFNVVVMVTASKDCSIEKIQSSIVEKLGLVVKDPNENKTADLIFNFLREKKFLLLLDDLWEKLDLKRVGIPFPLGLTDKYKRKVVLTTRLKGVCGQMMVRKEIQVALLSEDESWSLFRDNVGNETLDSHLQVPNLAKQVVRELGNLPLVLITIGRAMSGKTEPEDWHNTIVQLRAQRTGHINGREEMEEIYHRLKFSYENLPSETLKNCFLFCSLWPEDYLFKEDDLIKGWIGLGYIKEFDNIHIAYNTGHVIISDLSHRCLLMKEFDSVFGNQVKMHDVIRDMAHWIAHDFGANKNKWVIKTGGLTRLPNDEKLWCDAEYISFMNNYFSVQSCSVLSSPSNLSTLLLPKNRLNIFPINMSYVTNLRYLNLASNEISVIPPEICNLTTLQYLDLSENPIDSIPTELKALTNLKFLYLRWCKINSLPEGVILSLKSLEVLDLLGCNDSSIVDNSFLVEELKSLKNLKALEIPIGSSVLEKFNGLPIHSLCVVIHADQGNLTNKSFSINSNFSMETYRYLVDLYFVERMGCKYFIIEGGQFPNLETLIFVKMLDLIDIVWRGVLPKNVFPRLKILEITYCKVEHITWIAQLPCLQMLYVFDCANIKELVRSTEGSSSTNQQQPLQGFPSLKSINLHYLKKLESICDPDCYTFPSLRYLSIYNCPGFKKFPFPNGTVPPTVKLYTDLAFGN